MREGGRGRTTLVLDDDLVAKAQALTGVKEKTLLVREALKALIERESAKRLARFEAWKFDKRRGPDAPGARFRDRDPRGRSAA